MEKISEEKAMELTEEFLDTIDIKKLLKINRGKDLCEVCDYIENTYKDDWFIEANKNCFEGYVFNWMNLEEFIDYIRRRYPHERLFTETISYRV